MYWIWGTCGQWEKGCGAQKKLQNQRAGRCYTDGSGWKQKWGAGRKVARVWKGGQRVRRNPEKRNFSEIREEKVLGKEQCPCVWVLTQILLSNEISYKTICSIWYHLCNKLRMPEYFKKCLKGKKNNNKDKIEVWGYLWELATRGGYNRGSLTFYFTPFCTV